MNRTGRITIAALLSVLLAAAVAAGPAGAKPTKTGKLSKQAPAGLACLKGNWVSEGIVTPAFHGGAGTLLTITLSSHHSKTQYGIADADYDPSDPLYLTGVSGGYFKLTGSAFGRFEYLGHGRFHFDPTLSDEDVTVFADGKAIVGPEPVKGGNGFADIKCSASSFKTTVKVPTESGIATAVEVWKRTSH
jgi:hypothetical protein